MFAVTGDPWAQSPGDDKVGIIQAQKQYLFFQRLQVFDFYTGVM